MRFQVVVSRAARRHSASQARLISLPPSLNIAKFVNDRKTVSHFSSIKSFLLTEATAWYKCVCEMLC